MYGAEYFFSRSSFEEKLSALYTQLKMLEEGKPPHLLVLLLAVYVLYSYRTYYSVLTFSEHRFQSTSVCVCVCLGTDPEYLQEVARIKEEKEKRLFVAETFRNYETQCAKDDFEREKSLAETEFEVGQHMYIHVSNTCICCGCYMEIHVHSTLATCMLEEVRKESNPN